MEGLAPKELVLTKDQFIEMTASRSKNQLQDIAFEAVGYLLQFRNMLIEDTEPIDRDLTNRVIGLAQLREQFAYYYMLVNVLEGLNQMAEMLHMKDILAYDENKKLQQTAMQCAEICNVDIDKWKDANG